MKKKLTTLAAVLCCLATIVLFPTCSKKDIEFKSDLVGTWTEKNTLFTDILTMKEDGTFSFQSHMPVYNGTGYYRNEYITHEDPFSNKGVLDNANSVRTLILDYAGKGTELLEIRKITSSRLDMEDRYGNAFHFSK